MNENSNKFKELQARIEEAEREGQPIVELIKEQIALLQESHDKFVEQALAMGYNLDNERVGDIEIQQYTAMKQLAQKVGLSTKEYDEKIKETRIRIFGEINYKRFFEADK